MARGQPTWRHRGQGGTGHRDGDRGQVEGTERQGTGRGRGDRETGRHLKVQKGMRSMRAYARRYAQASLVYAQVCAHHESPVLHKSADPVKGYHGVLDSFAIPGRLLIGRFADLQIADW